MVEMNKFIKVIKANRIIIGCLLIYLSISGYGIHKDISFNTKTDNELYQFYLSYLDGPLTEEKEDYLNKENLLILESKNMLALSATNLFDNNISPEAFETIFQENEATIVRSFLK